MNQITQSNSQIPRRTSPALSDPGSIMDLVPTPRRRAWLGPFDVYATRVTSLLHHVQWSATSLRGICFVRIASRVMGDIKFAQERCSVPTLVHAG